jgi:hypothetical protein
MDSDHEVLAHGVEIFGSPDVRWIKGTVDPRDPNVFKFEPMQQESR